MTSDFGGSATGPDARHEGGSVSAARLDRPRNAADGPVPPRPEGLGGPARSRLWPLGGGAFELASDLVEISLALDEA